MSTAATSKQAIIYPESDGKRMAENTRQWRWITMIVGGLRALFIDRPDVFVAGDLLWYPVEGRPDICTAPDGMVTIGRPKGERGSYLQWKEGGLPPQVVFEVLSPANTRAEMRRKLGFYQQHGVDEYYVYDPDRNRVEGWLRQGDQLTAIVPMEGWVSPLLGIRFSLGPEELELSFPNGEPFVDFESIYTQRAEAQAQAQQAQAQAQQAQAQAQQAQSRQALLQAEAVRERERAERLAAKLRALGINPDEDEAL